jgi:hypothetical protein
MEISGRSEIDVFPIKKRDRFRKPPGSSWTRSGSSSSLSLDSSPSVLLLSGVALVLGSLGLCPNPLLKGDWGVKGSEL